MCNTIKQILSIKDELPFSNLKILLLIDLLENRH